MELRNNNPQVDHCPNRQASVFNSTPGKIPSAIVRVEFGSPMKNCLHFGICRVTTPVAIKERPCGCWSLATVFLLDDNLLQFVFYKNKMSKKVFEKYFKKGIFQVDAAYELPTEDLLKSGPKKQIIRPGRYLIQKEGNLLKITF